MAKLRLGIIVGSTRRDSINRKLAQALAKLGANAFDATFLKIDDLPLYNQDNEQPVPDAVARFKREVAASDALLFVTPEHSRSIPAALKNAIDWGGRPYGTSVWPGKPAAVIGASPGAISTAIAQNHLRSVLGTFSGMHFSSSPTRSMRTITFRTKTCASSCRPSSTSSPASLPGSRQSANGPPRSHRLGSFPSPLSRG